MTAAIWRGKLIKRATSHCLEPGDDIRTEQELLGHASVETMMIYFAVVWRAV